MEVIYGAAMKSKPTTKLRKPKSGDPKGKRKTCCICGMGFSEWGHNPDPVKSSGTCCDSCNDTYVIPARLRTARQRELLDEIDRL